MTESADLDRIAADIRAVTKSVTRLLLKRHLLWMPGSRWWLLPAQTIVDS